MAKNNKSLTSNIGTGVKESIRKGLVFLKKNPQFIPLLAHTIAFLVFSLNLTAISRTTGRVYGSNMGLCEFIIMLFSILVYVCLFSAFPKRQKPNITMLAALAVLYAIIIFADVHYYNCIIIGIAKEEGPLEANELTKYIPVAQKVIITHIITTIISAIIIALEPVYAKLLKKINTSVEVEYTANIDSIDISDEE